MNTHGSRNAAIKTIFSAALLVLGLYTGSALADSDKRASLFQALMNLHRSKTTDVIFATSSERSPEGSQQQTVSQDSVTEVALRYGLNTVSVGGVHVLVPVLAEAHSTEKRLDALSRWQDGLGGAQRWRSFTKDTRSRSQALSEELGPGSKSYSELSDSQRRAVDDLLRRIQIDAEVSNLNYLMYGHNFSSK